ncbi:PH domain-containing protein [Anatilimnocola floriformis]|uniref:PH domain-containing protein n=1 Tax=Anatilimnocola floriformis TaxID=2948575 RepID=UPI0020C2214C|nr:PH domain-containing protein [Anatilimnocola floriformis]
MTTVAVPAPQAIAGVTPAQTQETTVMTVWPSVAAYGIGRTLGQLYDIRMPDIYFLRLGRLLALAFVPVSLVLFFFRVAPYIGTRYTLTNRRLIVHKGWKMVEDKAIDLDRFDKIEVEVLPGQSWYEAGDLVFKLGNVETFRLDGVSRPEAFRSTVFKAHQVYVGVKKAQKR